MPPPNPKKRSAPGSSPVPAYSQPQMQHFPNNASNQISDADFLRYNQEADNASFDSNNYGMNFGGNALSQAPLGQNLPAQSTQLTRRPHSRQLVQSGQRYDMSPSPWEGLIDSNGNGVMEENDNIEVLEKRAAEAKKEAKSAANGRKQIPPFVQKLSSFLDESKNTDLIRWSDKGDSFIVLDEDEFAKTLIPELFKHNNYASFVRQLNMYGFHKRVGLSDNSMRASERKNKSPSEYYNSYFKRGHPNLLWLINKPPKGGPGKHGKKGVKSEEAQDSDDEAMEGVEDVVSYGTSYNNNMQTGSRVLSAAPENAQLPRRELALVQTQLSRVQRNQSAMMNMIQQIRQQHSQLYNEAQRFQGLHERHDNSINAILTFLATVYNRSLDGQNPQNINFSQLFNSGNLQDLQPPNGNVVDMGEVGNQQQAPASVSPNRRAQRLLMAPPTAGRAATLTPSAASTPGNTSYIQNQGQTPRSGTVEEVFDSNSPADASSPNTQAKPEGPDPYDPQQDMMNLINSTNAQSQNSSTQNQPAMEFPEVLSHYQTANGNTPLSAEQRNNMLSLMSNSVGGTNNNNALTTPNPPTPPNFGADLNLSAAEIDELLRMQSENEGQIEDVTARLNGGSLPPLSPLPNYASSDGGVSGNLDLDQFLDSGAYYNGGDTMGQGGFGEFDNFGDGNGFNLGFDGTGDDMVDGEGQSRVKDEESSAGASPEEVKVDGDREVDRGHRSPSKKRRKG